MKNSSSGRRPGTIAVIFDFDDTLAPDSTSGFLDSIGIDVPQFWQRHAQRLQQGWDPIPGYLEMMIQESGERDAAGRITKSKLQSWGRRVKCYRGVGQMFERLRRQCKRLQVPLELYLISSGIGEVLRATPIAGEFNDIWASDFAYNNKGEIYALKNVVSFTDKTRFVFRIAKGLIGDEFRNDPFAVNRKVPADALHVPLDHMIVIGDGFTDIPCFSLIRKAGGVAIGVYDRESRERWGKAWGFIEDHRVTHLVAADYRKCSGLDDALTMAIERIAQSIALRSITYQG